MSYSISVNLKNAIFVSFLTISTIFYLCYGHLNSKRLQLELFRQQKTKTFLADQSEKVKVLEAQVKYLKGRQLGLDDYDENRSGAPEEPTLNNFFVETKSDKDQQVKFYVYDFPQTNWYINCSKDHSNYMNKLTSPLEKHYFHSDDIIFSRKIVNHKWRTYNPDEASIFVLPFLFNFFAGFGGQQRPFYRNKEKPYYSDKNKNKNNNNIGITEYQGLGTFFDHSKNMKCNGWSYLEMLKNTEDFLFDKNNNFGKNSKAKIPSLPLVLNTIWFHSSLKILFAMCFQRGQASVTRRIY